MARIRPGLPARGSKSGRPIMALLDLLGRRWALRLVWELREGNQTFRALARAVQWGLPDRPEPAVGRAARGRDRCSGGSRGICTDGRGGRAARRPRSAPRVGRALGPQVLLIRTAGRAARRCNCTLVVMLSRASHRVARRWQAIGPPAVRQGVPHSGILPEMRARVLGSSAGGGLPQWNCGCSNCARARAGDPSIPMRTQPSLAVSADGVRWSLINASPDVRDQLARFSALHPRPGTRDLPLDTIVLTNADLDHVLGLLVLRESLPYRILSTAWVRDALLEHNAVFRILEPAWGLRQARRTIVSRSRERSRSSVLPRPGQGADTSRKPGIERAGSYGWGAHHRHSNASKNRLRPRRARAGQRHPGRARSRHVLLRGRNLLHGNRTRCHKAGRTGCAVDGPCADLRGRRQPRSPRSACGSANLHAHQQHKPAGRRGLARTALGRGCRCRGGARRTRGRDLMRADPITQQSPARTASSSRGRSSC